MSAMMEIHDINVDSIVVGDRMRAINPEKVDILAKSMTEIGLQTPITVWATEDGYEVHLIAGRHRLAAAIKLGWEDISCNVVAMNDIDRKRWEIAENLHRSELTALERDQHISEWERLGLEAEAEKVRKDSALKEPGKGRGSKGGTREVARELGVDEKAVRNARKVSTLTDEAKEVARETGLDKNRSALLKAASKPAEEQAATLEDIAKEKLGKSIERSSRRINPNRIIEVTVMNFISEAETLEMDIREGWLDAEKQKELAEKITEPLKKINRIHKLMLKASS